MNDYNFKYRDDVYYEDSGTIQKALFSESWMFEGSYISKNGEQLIKRDDELFPSKKALLEAKLHKIKKTIEINDKFIDELISSKPLLEKQVMELDKELKKKEYKV